MFGHSFVMQYLVSFLVLQSSRWGRECLLLYFNYLLYVIGLLVFTYFLLYATYGKPLSFKEEHMHLSIVYTQF